MIKYITLILVVFTLAGCCCKPQANFTSGFSSDIGSSSDIPQEARNIMNTKTNETLELLKAQKYDEFIDDTNLMSGLVLAKPDIIKLMRTAIPCLEDHFGVLESWDKSKRTFSTKTNDVDGKTLKQFIVKQPVHYTDKDVSIVLTFNKEDGTYKISYLKWSSKDLTDLEFFKCFVK